MQSIFGTDGIRGKFNDKLTSSLAKKVGYALGNTLIKEGSIVIGHDTRVSSKILLEAISSGLNSANKNVVDIGICPTPAIQFLVKKFNFSCGIMITASHNPPEYNGIKIFDENGKKLNKSKEKVLEQKINLIKNTNILKRLKNKNAQRFDLLETYENSLISSTGTENLEGLKIILDTCHGSATICAEKIFQRLGANVTVINNEPDGSKININCGSTHIKTLKKLILEGDYDMGFSFDGDADRVVGIDSSGNVLDGDHILFLFGKALLEEKKLSNNIIVSTVMTNLGFENSWEKLGGILIRTPVGDKFIYEELIKREADLGGEQSGHILLKRNNFIGDGLFTAILIAKHCKERDISLKTWLKSSFLAFPQKLTNIKLPNHIKELNLSTKKFISQMVEENEKKLMHPCRIFVRPSGTEAVLRILVEAENKKLVEFYSEKISAELEEFIKKS